MYIYYNEKKKFFIIFKWIRYRVRNYPSLAASFNINESVYISTEDGNFTELNMNISSFKLYASNLVNISEDINIHYS